MNSKNEVFEYLIDQLRQQVNSNPYKQQCEDLAREVRSLKNQLRDMSEVVDELMGTITLMNGDVEAYRVLRKGGYGFEQSGYRKEDVRLPVCQCIPAHCGTYRGNIVVCDNCGGEITE